MSNLSHIRSSRLQELQHAAEDAQRRREMYEREISDRSSSSSAIAHQHPSSSPQQPPADLGHHSSIIDAHAAHDACGIVGHGSSGHLGGDDGAGTGGGGSPEGAGADHHGQDSYTYVSPPSYPHDLDNDPAGITPTATSYRNDGGGGVGPAAKLRRSCNTLLSRVESCVENRFGSALLLTVVVIAVAIGYSVHVSRNDQRARPPDGTITSTAGTNTNMTPDEMRRVERIHAKLAALSGEQLVTNPKRHQFWAVQWISYDDGMKLDAESPYLIQRYVLALLYYTLGMDGAGSMGGGEGGGGGGVGGGWLSSTWECTWHGVECDDTSHVTGLVGLDGLGLTGTLPPELSALTELRRLDLSSNRLGGTIPTEMGKLVNLEGLALDGNDMTGSVPKGLCTLVEAGTLRVFTADCGDGGGDADAKVICGCCTSCSGGSGGAEDGGTSLTWSGGEGGLGTSGSGGVSVGSIGTGSLRREDGIRAAIAEVSPETATATGTAQYRALDWILNGDGRKVGPDSPNLIQRYTVAVLYYAMGGELWPYLPWLDGTKSECHFVGLACNERGRVVDISLVSSNLSGSIPKEIGELVDLSFLDLRSNGVGGSLPREIGNLLHLETLLLQDNSLSGSVSTKICALRQESLIDFRTDCDTSPPEVSCTCCNNCGGATVEASTPQSNAGTGSSSSTVDVLSGAVDAPPSGAAKDNTSREAAIINTIEQQFDNGDEPSRARARNWLIHDDPQHLSAADPNLIQRYILSVLYFSLGGSGWSVSSWIANGGDECQWDGVACDKGGAVIGLALESNNVVGDLPHEISRLRSLKALDFSKNRIKGSIPAEFGDLTKLEILILYENEITGVVPEAICNRKDDEKLSVLWLDCGIEAPKVHCPCCTKCS